MRTLLIVLSITGALFGQTERAREAMKKFEQAGALAREGKYEPANQLMQQAFIEFDEAVNNAPGEFTPRLMRGLVYAHLPPFLNKTPIGKADLEWATARPEFAREPEARQARVRERLTSLAATAGPKDRFPQIADTVSPVIAVASYTIPGKVWDRAAMDPRMLKFVGDLEKQPGLEASHLMTSIDRPGMLVILTSWKDKKALNDWFYGSVHQGMIQEVYGGPRPASKEGGPTQVAMELFTALPGGMRFSGGLFTRESGR